MYRNIPKNMQLISKGKQSVSDQSVSVRYALLTVTIGIPAYNEQQNISYLIESLLNQLQNKFTLERIIIASDGSTDKTVDIVEGFVDKRIYLLRGKKRLGQPARQNQMARLNKSDIFVLLEADTLPANRKYISNLIMPFLDDKKEKIGMTYGKRVVLSSRNFFENIMNYSFNLKRELLNHVPKKHNLYLFGGQSGRAIHKELLKKIEWKNDAPEDTYSYIFCIKNGFSIEYCDKAKIYFRLVSNFTDYCKQSGKYLKARKSLIKYFGESVAKEHYIIPKTTYLQFIIREILTKPHILFFYLLIMIGSRVKNIRAPELNPYWEIYPSSKILVLSEKKYV